MNRNMTEQEIKIHKSSVQSALAGVQTVISVIIPSTPSSTKPSVGPTDLSKNWKNEKKRNNNDVGCYYGKKET